MRRRIEGLYRRFRGLPCYIAVALAVLLFSGMACSYVMGQSMVTVADSRGNSATLFTDCGDAREIVRLAGFSVGENDRMQYTGEGPSGTAQVYIQRAFPVALTVDGESFTTQVPQGTVRDLLAQYGVRLGPDDFVQPAQDTPLCEDMVVRVRRVKYVDEVRREQPSDDALRAYIDGLPVDSGFVLSHNGLYHVTYRDCMVDGVLASSGVLQMTPVVAPRAQDSYEITEGVPCSRIEGFDDVEMGLDGLPVNYTSLMEDAVCTAYSSSGGKGASGLGLYCGTVAVDPGVIPYGTRLYITSADGKFIYGFAIATDTGTAMMEGRVDIDLYFETNEECREFGKRNLNVYVLD